MSIFQIPRGPDPMLSKPAAAFQPNPCLKLARSLGRGWWLGLWIACCACGLAMSTAPAWAAPQQDQEDATDQTDPTDPSDPTDPTDPTDPSKQDDQPQLKFNFDDQPWPEVLQWFARQAGMSLVINEAPAGGFSFRDARAYTPTESIDLLNSVLLTKGFTLVRKDAMLILIDTKSGIPYDLVPHKSIAELDSCGRFELVTVTFPLDGRPIDAVQNEIQPLIGSLGRAVPLPATGQMLVTETAGRMAAIHALIQSVPKPSPRPRPDPPAKPPPQVLQTYVITDLGLSATAELLRSAVGISRLTVDEQTNQVFIYATEAQHGEIERILTKLRETPRPTELKVQTYRYLTGQPAALIEQLRAMLPGVLFQADAGNQRLIAIADQDMHDRIQQALEALEGPLTTTLSLKSYVVPRDSHAEAITALERIVPGVTVTPHSAQDQLMVIARETQHAQVQQVVEQMSEAGVIESVGDRSLVTFPVQHIEPAEAARLLQALQPGLEVQIDAANRRLLIVLRSQQAERIQQWLRTMDQPTADATAEVQIYRVPTALEKYLLPLIAEQIPRAKTTYDADSEQLLVTGSAAMQQQVSRLLESLQPSVPAQAELRDYVVSRQAYKHLSDLLPERLPRVRPTYDPATQQLLAIATGEDHQRLKSLIESLEAIRPEPTDLKTYSVPQTVQPRVQEALERLVPELALTWEPESDRLLAYLTAADHLRLAEALEQLSEAGLMTARDRRRLQIFAVQPEQGERFQKIQSSLPEELAGLRLLEDDDPRQVIAWGTDRELTSLGQLLESLADDDPQRQRVLAVYPVRQGDPQVVHDLLARLFPTAELQVDIEAGRVIVWAEPGQQDQIKQAVQQLDESAQSGWTRVLKTYVIRELDLTIAMQTLTQLVPEITLSLDPTSKQLIAYGRQKDHEKLEALIEQLRAGTAAESREVKVYEVRDQDPVALAGILNGLAPTAVVATQRGAQSIAVWATAEEHEAIGAAIEQLTAAGQEKRELKILSTRYTGASEAVRFLRGAAPDGVFFPSEDGQSLFAFATPEQQVRVQGILSQLEERNSQSDPDVLQAYRYPKAVLQAAQPLLATRVPQAQPMSGAGDEQWLIWATPEDHQVIEQMLQDLQQNLPVDVDFRLQIHRLQRVSTAEAQTAISSVVGTVTYLSTTEPGQLRIWTDGPRQRQVEALLQQLEEQLTAGETELPLKVYPIDPKISVALVADSLDPQLLAQGSVVQNTQRNALLIRASQETHEAIGTAIEEFLQALPPAVEPSPRSYEVQHLAPTAALSLLSTLVPTATYAIDATNNRLAVTALDEDHQRIAAALAEIDVPASADLQTKAYRVPTGYAAAISTSLTPLYPQARITTDATGSAVLVAARQSQQQEIDRIIREMIEGSEASGTTEVYQLSTTSPFSALSVVQQIYPRTQGTVDRGSRAMVITATPQEHEKIADLLEKMESSGRDRTMVAYPIRKAQPSVVQAAISEAVPRATVSLDSTRDLLIVTADPEAQEEIASLIEELEQGPEKPPLVARSYALQHLSPTAVVPLLTTLVPTATYAIDEANNKIAVSAQEEQHLEIAQALQQIDVAGDGSLVTRAYRVPTGYASAITSSLTPMYPQAKISTDFTGSVVVVAARVAQHDEIDRVIREILEGTEDSTLTKVYSLSVANPTSALAVIKQVFPRSQGTVDSDSGTVVITASPTEHQRVADLLEQIEAAGNDRTVVPYMLRSVSARAIQQAISQTIPRANVSVDRNRDLLVVAASPAEHQQIQELLAQLDRPSSEDLMTRAYRMTTADPRSAETALQTLLPTVQFSPDTRSGFLWATADPQQHEMIQQVVDQLESAEQENTRVQAFQVPGGSSDDLYSMLQRMYRGDNDVRLSYQASTDTILFVGPPKQEMAVQQIVEQWGRLAEVDSGREIKNYDLMELDGDVVVESLEKLLEGQTPRPSLQVQFSTNRLLAIATPGQHAKIAAALEQVRGDARRMEVFNLVVNSPETVEDAIRSLFLDLPFSASPSVNASRETQQLFIRANESQLEEIRQLLVKLGEPPDVLLGESASGAGLGRSVFQGEGNLRVLRSPDARQLLEQIQVLWPQISSHPLEVIGVDPAPELLRQPGGSAPPSQLDLPESGGSADPPTTGPDGATDLQRVPTTLATAPPVSPVPAPVADDQVNQPSDDQDQQQDKPAPVLIIPSAGELTIASSDPEALALFQQLVEILSQQRAEAGKVEISGNFTIFQLENAGATEMAATVSRLYQQIAGGQTRGRGREANQSRVSVVADERLNSLIVYGPPNDRRTIESLIRVLDTTDTTRSGIRVNEPLIVKVENVLADKIMGVLESVYRTQLRPDQPPRIQIPAGVSVEVAVALREVNAAAAAPLLTLEVDQATNSIIVLASERLGAEVESLIHRLDRQHKEGNEQGFRVIALEKGNTERIEQSLRRLIQDYQRGGRRGNR